MSASLVVVVLATVVVGPGVAVVLVAAEVAAVVPGAAVGAVVRLVATGVATATITVGEDPLMSPASPQASTERLRFPALIWLGPTEKLNLMDVLAAKLCDATAEPPTSRVARESGSTADVACPLTTKFAATGPAPGLVMVTVGEPRLPEAGQAV